MACGWQNSCRPWSCNYLQNAGATTYKNFLQFYAKKACKKHDNEKAEKQPKAYQRKKEDHEFDLLIDIQKKLAQGKGKYYVRFAKNFNTKQVAKAVLYLKQHDIRSYDDLEKNVKTATERFTELSASIKAKEKRLAEIQVLKKHIFDYFKTKDAYADTARNSWKSIDRKSCFIRLPRMPLMSFI